MSTTLLLLLGAGLFLALGRKNRRAEQIGRIKRRIYKEVSLAQSAGVDFTKNFGDLTEDEIVVLESVGSDAGWKQSKRSIEAGKSYAESYYGSLRRAWNAVSGVQGIGKAYNVKDADGNLVLTWIEDAAEHVAREREVEELEKKIRQTRNRMKRRQREIDRKGFVPQPQPTPAEVKVEESAEVIDQPDTVSEYAPSYNGGFNMDAPINQKRIALLNKAQHMGVIHAPYGSNNVVAKGDERYNLLDWMNYVLMAKVVYTNLGSGEKMVTIYPMYAGDDEDVLKAFMPNEERSNKFKEDYRSTKQKKILETSRVNRTFKIVPIMDVDIASISGVSGWRDIEELHEDIYDAVQDFINYPDGYERPVLHVYMSDGECVAEVDDNLPISENNGVYDIYSLIRDGEPDIDAISDIANSWAFLD